MYLIMKRILLFTVIIFSLFTWSAKAQFVESFDSGVPATWTTFKLLNGAPSAAGFVPNWTANTQTAYDCLNPDLGTPPAKVIVLGQNILDGNTSQSWLVTEQVTVPVNGQLEFISRTTAGILPAYSGTRFMVKVSTTSQTDVASFGTMLIDYNQTQISGGGTYNACTQHILNLAAFVGQDIYIAFIKEDSQIGTANMNNGWVLDDVKVLEKCLVPTNAQATPQATTADITWTGNANNYEVSLILGAGTPETGTIYPTTTNSIELTDLTSSTSYMYYIRAICEFNSSEWAGPFTFYTTQIPFDIGLTGEYSEGFENPSFGFSLLNGTQTNKWVVGTAAQYGGTKSMYISNDNGGSNTYSLSSASTVHSYRDIQMPAVLGEVYFSFDWRSFGEVNSDYLRVWVVPSTYTPTPGTQITTGGGRIQVGSNFGSHNSWQTHTQIVNAPAAWENQIMRLVFEWRNNASAGTQPPAAVDNVLIKLITCSAPSAPSIGNLSATEVTFNWNAPSGTPPASYDYYFTTTSGTPTSTTIPTANVPSNTATIDNLVPSTTYYFWIRSNCGPDGESFWVGPISFNTAQVPTSLDYFEDFEGANPGWTLNNGTQTNKWVVGTATSNSPTHSLYISENNGTTNTYNGTSNSIVTAYKDLIIPATAEQVHISFDWKATGEGNVDYMRAWLVPVTFTPTPGSAITGGGGRVQLGANFNQQNTWQTESFVLNVPNTWSGQIMRLVFEWRNNNSIANQSPAAVDNINFSVITCPAPSNPTLLNVTTSTATTSWTGNAASYDYYYSTTNTAPESTTTPSGNAATNQANLTGLTDATVYYFWVRSNCGVDGVSFWVGPLIFNTAQIPASLPYYENFDGTTSNFTFNNGLQVNKWFVGGATFNSPSQSLYISNDEGVSNAYGGTTSTTQAYRDIEMPATTLGQLHLSFDWKGIGENNADYMRVWLVPISFTPTPGNQITAGAGRMQIGTNYTQQATWKTENIVLNAPAVWSGQTLRLVFEWRNNGSTFNLPPAAVDNISFSVVTCPAPSNLAVVSTTENAATFSWNAPTGTAPASYDYFISTTNISPSPTDVPTGTSATNSVTIEGLDAGTQYYFWVRSNCGTADGNSYWVGPIMAQTLACNPDDQCLYTFILTDTYGDGWNGNTMSVIQGGVTVGTLAMTSGATLIVTVPLCDGTPFSLYWNLGGSFSNEVGVTILDPFAEDVFTKAPGVGFPGSTLYTGEGDCTPPTCPKPQNITVTQITQYTAVLDWTEIGTATLWEYVVLPANQTPDATTVFTQTTTHPVTLEGLEGGTNYRFWVRAICSDTDSSNLVSLPFTTAPAPPITVSITQYTVPQLVEDILIGSECVEISNITWSTGTNYNSTNGIGYFEKSGSNFPFHDGIVLSTGSAMAAPGPKGTATQSNGASNWPGDASLSALLAANGTSGTLYNATVLEFDFVALTDSMSFDFIFASEEYGTFQCSFADVFGFFLTDMTTNITTNLAVVPNTNIPISVTTIRDNAYNGSCSSQNPQYFGQYFDGTSAASQSAAINFRGQTVPLTASSTVIPGNTYHIKLAIADFSDSSWDSAVFLLGGSFDLGQINLGADLLVDTNNALCVGEEYLIESGVDPDGVEIVWYHNEVIIDGANSPDLIVTESGTYKIEVTVVGSTCPATDSIVIEFYEDMQEVITDPINLFDCSAGDVAVFDLTVNIPIILEGYDLTIYNVTFYTTLEDAEAEVNPIPNPESYTNISNPQTIYTVVHNTLTGCRAILTFQLIITDNQDVVTSFTYDDTIYCIAGANPILIPSQEMAIGGSYSVAPSGLTINSQTGAIDLSTSAAGNYTITYELTANGCNNGGASTFDIEVIGLSAPQLEFSYAESCVNAAINPQINATGLTPGGVFSSTTLSVDAVTGEIDIENATLGSHQVTYTVQMNPATCIAAGSYVATIIFSESIVPITNFDYGIGVYCHTDGDISPTKANNFFEGGVFSSTNGLSINATTGVVNTSASTPGVYNVTYTVAEDEATCNEGGSSQTTITIQGEFMIAIMDECRNNNYWLLANPVNSSFDPATATYTWMINGIEVGYGAEVSITDYLNGADIPQGGINVTVIVNDGCESSAQFLVTSTICMIQKGISPNGDSANNNFDLTGMGVQKLSIFNRYGMEVYSKTNYVNEWTGLDNKGNELPDGTYFYVIHKNNGEKMSSWIYINRKI
jgi:gliding motility-associated-like protein